MQLFRFTFLTFFVLFFLFYTGATADDDVSHWTSVGNIGLTVTNFGTIGHGFTLWPSQPFCAYPKSSGIEHLFDGRLWVGGRKNGIIMFLILS